MLEARDDADIDPSWPPARAAFDADDEIDAIEGGGKEPNPDLPHPPPARIPIPMPTPMPMPTLP